jgi:hypothetical protein
LQLIIGVSPRLRRRSWPAFDCAIGRDPPFLSCLQDFILDDIVSINLLRFNDPEGTLGIAQIRNSTRR